MSDRWFIIKDGKALGPFTPEEIRQSLREGTFDPFDLVTREGSSVRRELVEVDELFYTTKVVYAGDQPSASGQAPSAASEAFAPSGNLPMAREATQASGGVPEGGNGVLQLASAARATLASQAPNRSSPAPQQSPSRKRRRDPKRFQVMDPRGRVLGPISASEIQALFYKGVLDKDVKVMRDGSKAQVPVARFVAIYSETNRAKRAMQQGAHPAMQGGISRAQSVPVPRIAMGTPSSSVSPIAVVAIVFALLFGGIAVYVFLKGADSWSARERPAATKVDKPRGQRRVVRPLPDGKRDAPPSQQTAKPTPAELKKAERMADLKRQRAKLLELKQRREATQRGQKGKNKLAKTVAVTKPVQKPGPVQKPVPTPVQKPAQTSTPPPALKPSGVQSLQDGQQVQKLGPMTFDKSALQACEGSCNLTFTGAGGSVKVAFFKQVWGPALEGKSGGVYLSGLVKKNGDAVKIILSNVQ